MKVLWDGAVCLEKGPERLYLDPKRRRPQAIVTHAHLDHMVEGAVMTPQTRDIMVARSGREDFPARVVPLDGRSAVGGFEVELSEAGHVLGSAMVKADDTLYTGDFNTFTGITCGAAAPRKCDTLVIEATYGSPRFVLPDQEGVVSDLLSWMESGLEEGSVILGSYEFGKAQDLVALANSIRAPVVVPDRIGAICDVYRRHGVTQDCTPLSRAGDVLLGSPHVLVTSRRELKHPVPEHIGRYRRKGAAAAFVSGWTAFMNYGNSHDIDVQFPFSNHCDFNRIMDFVERCSPRKVYTVHGSCEALAAEIRSRLGIDAEPLE
ncbi:MAG: hypothetical protein FJ149_04335 [Euryarchaeota archaeon]|nr:hypothetical protein [Euryarchaeota archaeon]